MALYLSKDVISVMRSELGSIKKRKAYNKHKNVGFTIKRRDSKKETPYGAVNSELTFWREVGNVKNSIDLMDLTDLDNLSKEEIVEIFKRHSKTFKCTLNYNSKDSQFIRIHR